MNDPFGDEPNTGVFAHVIGQDLSTLSLHEIADRIAMLRAEIVRLEEARASKAASRDAAASVFKF